MFYILDLKTKYKVGKEYKSFKRAWSRVEKLELQYGFCRYTVKEVFENDIKKMRIYEKNAS